MVHLYPIPDAVKRWVWRQLINALSVVCGTLSARHPCRSIQLQALSHLPDGRLSLVSSAGRTYITGSAPAPS